MTATPTNGICSRSTTPTPPGPAWPNESVALPQATAAAVGPFFVSTFGNQQHFTYLDGNGNLQDCWYDGNQWNLQQINNADPAGPSVPNESVALPQATAAAVGPFFVSTFGNQQHFTYLDGNANLQDCWYDGDANQWNLQQINNANPDGPSAANESVALPQATAPAASGPFVCTFGTQQHFTYLDDNRNLQDCWWDGNQWNLRQINNANPDGPSAANESVALPQATAPAVSGPFVSTFGNQLHFSYVDDNNNLQDCWWDGNANQWNLLQINNANAAVPSVANESVALPQATAPAVSGPFVCTFGNQHFTYLDDNNNLQDCWLG